MARGGGGAGAGAATERSRSASSRSSKTSLTSSSFSRTPEPSSSYFRSAARTRAPSHGSRSSCSTSLSSLRSIEPLPFQSNERNVSWIRAVPSSLSIAFSRRGETYGIRACGSVSRRSTGFRARGEATARLALERLVAPRFCRARLVASGGGGSRGEGEEVVLLAEDVALLVAAAARCVEAVKARVSSCICAGIEKDKTQQAVADRRPDRRAILRPHKLRRPEVVAPRT